MKRLHSFLNTPPISWSSISPIPWRRRCRNRSRNFWFRFIKSSSFKSPISIKSLRISSTKRKLTSFNVFQSQNFPIEERRKTFSTVALIDPLTSCFLGELEHLIGQLIDAFVDRFHSSVH